MMSPSPSVSTSWPGCTVPSACKRVGVAGLVPDVPQRTVFLAQTPEREGLQAERARGAHLVEQVTPSRNQTTWRWLRVLVDVLVVGIERVVVEVEIGVGVGGALPGVGDGQIFGIERPAAWQAWSRVFGIGDRKRPVVAVVADGADDLLLWARS